MGRRETYERYQDANGEWQTRVVSTEVWPDPPPTEEELRLERIKALAAQPILLPAELTELVRLLCAHLRLA